MVSVIWLQTDDARPDGGDGVFPDLETKLGWELGEMVEGSFKFGFLGCSHRGVEKCFRGRRQEVFGIAGACQWNLLGRLIHVVVD